MYSNGGIEMRKRIFLIAILLLISIIAAIYMKHDYKRINEIGGFKSSDVTKIAFQYDNPANKGGTVEDKEKIQVFMSYLNSCTLAKKRIQTPMDGYYQLVVLFKGKDEIMRIMTYENFIEINEVQYSMVKNKLSLEKIDDCIKSLR